VSSRYLGLCATGLVGLLALAACGAAVDDAKHAPGATALGGSSGTAADPSSVCGASRLGAPRLRRLSRGELQSTLADVFPEAKAAWTLTLSADAISPQGFDNDATLLIVGNQTAAELDRAGDAVESR